MSKSDRLAVLIGHSGLLGHALEHALAQGVGGYAGKIVPPHRNLVNAVAAGGGVDEVAAILDLSSEQDWICAVGAVDPNAGSVLEAVNTAFPLRLQNLLSNLARGGDIRLVTLGSTLEARPELAKTNRYLASKLSLFETLAGRSTCGWRHIRLHTLYGGSKRPHPAMFAGQMYDALANDTPFRMSGGLQLREYHHVDEIATSILAYLGSEAEDPLIDLSCGAPVRLRDLALAVFNHFGASDHLEIGAVSHVDAEVFDATFQASHFLAGYRDPLSGVISWFEQLGLMGRG